MKVCSVAVLDYVIGPKGLGAVVDIDGFEVFFAVGRSERDVLRRMPVLRENDVINFFCEGVDDRDDSVSIGDGQAASGHEVVLDVDDEEGVGGLEDDRH